MIRSIVLESDGLRLAGQLYEPPGAGLHPALCICHGIPAVPYNPADTGYRDLAARFADLGFVTLVFNMRGAGASEGNFDMPGWSRDIGSAVGFLSRETAADPSKVFLMGFSGGAAAGIHRASTDTRVAGVVSCASPAHFRDLIDDGALNVCIARWRDIGIIRDADFPGDIDRWAQGFVEISPAAHVGLLAPRPLLLLHGDADEVVPISHAYALFDAARDPKQLAVIPGGVHRLRVDERAMLTAANWLLSHTAS